MLQQSLELGVWHVCLECADEVQNCSLLCENVVETYSYETLTLTDVTTWVNMFQNKHEDSQSESWNKLFKSFLGFLIEYFCLLPVVLYGYETCSLTLREEHSLRLFENRVLRKIFGPKRDVVTWEWSRLHNEELYDLYSPPNIIRVVKSRRMRCARHVACMRERRGA